MTFANQHCPLPAADHRLCEHPAPQGICAACGYDFDVLNPSRELLMERVETAQRVWQLASTVPTNPREPPGHSDAEYQLLCKKFSEISAKRGLHQITPSSRRDSLKIPWHEMLVVAFFAFASPVLIIMGVGVCINNGNLEAIFVLLGSSVLCFFGFVVVPIRLAREHLNIWDRIATGTPTEPDGTLV